MTRIVGGLYPPDEGRLVYRGKPLALSSPARALAVGIGVIHQELNLVPELSVTANVFLGHEPRTRLFQVDDRAMRRRAASLLDLLGASFSPSALVGELTLAQQQLTEIARVLNHDPALLIMDEPTASLSVDSARRLFDVTRELRARGVAIGYISHELEDVFELADLITVLKDGRRMMTKPASETSSEEVVRRMVGRKLADLFPPRSAKRRVGTERPMLAVSGLTLPGHFADVSFELHAGEVLGFAGLVGAGRTAVAQAIFGSPPGEGAVSGSVRVHGEEVRISSPRDAVRCGIAYSPEDRKTEGLVLELSVTENIALPQLRLVSRRGVVDRNSQRRLADEQVAALRIETASPDAEARRLSGGNQQKVALAKWLARRSPILLLDEPTRGVDIGAKVEIYQLIRNLADEGAAVMLISSALPEVIGLSDRIIVMAKGRVVAERNELGATEEELLSAALGLSMEEEVLRAG
jgi:ABC-type sugar transport system ATPase subunit